jgi:hypothetical protein
MRTKALFKLSIGWKLFFLILASIVIGTLAYFGIVLLAFPVFSNDWNLLDGFVGVISFALLVGSLTFALTEYIGTEKAKEADKAKLAYEIYKAIFEKLTDPEQEAARRWILSNIDIKKEDEEIAAWYKRTNTKVMRVARDNISDLPEGQKAVKLTLNCFDYIGFIANHYWEIEADSLDWISAPIAKVWGRIGPYVMHIRTLRNTTDYYLSAEYLGELCVKWRQDKGLDDEEYVKKTL